jgi:hypothetical protein
MQAVAELQRYQYSLRESIHSELATYCSGQLEGDPSASFVGLLPLPIQKRKQYICKPKDIMQGFLNGVASSLPARYWGGQSRVTSSGE